MNIVEKAKDLWLDFEDFLYTMDCHYFNPFNIVKINSLPPTYQSADTLLLHSSFQILSNFLEDEIDNIEDLDWSDSGETEHAINEMFELYDWWNLERPRREDPLDYVDYPEEKKVMCEDGITCKYEFVPGPLADAFEAAMEESIELMDLWEQEDTDNLIRLMKIRSFLVF